MLINSQRSSRYHEEKLTRLRPAKAELKVRVKSVPADRRTHTWVCYSVHLCRTLARYRAGLSSAAGAGLGRIKQSQIFSLFRLRKADAEVETEEEQ